MTILDSDGPTRRSTLAILLAGTGAAITGVLVLLGWHTHTELFIRLLSGLPPMKYNAAVGFLVSGIGLGAVAYRRHRLVLFAGTLVGLLGALTLVEFLAGISLQIDTLIVAPYVSEETITPGRMAPPSAITFLLTGVGLVLVGLPSRVRHRPFVLALFGFISAALGVVALFGYMMRIEPAYGWGEFSQMALHAAIGAVVLGAGLTSVAWRDDVTERQMLPRWLPLLAGVAGITATLVLNRALSATMHTELNTGSPLPAVTFVVGLLMTSLLILALWSWEMARRRAREAESAHAQLATEIEERQEMEAALRESEAHYRELFESVPVGLYKTTPVGNMLEANRALVDILGYPDKDTLLGTRAADMYVDASDREQWRTKLHKDGIARDAEFQVYQHDGTPIWVRHTARRIEDETGVYFEGAVEDITERRRIEQELARSEELFRSVVENSSDIITIVEADGTIQFESPSVERILGYAPDERVGENAFSFVHPNDIPIITEAFSNVLQEPGTVLSVEYRVRHKDGSWRHMSSTGANLLDNPTVKGIVATSRDLTDRVNAEQELQQTAEDLRRSNQELEQFAYVASHDLQEPLRMVSSYVQLLARRYEGQLDDDADDFIAYAVDGATRMQRLINDLLAYSRVGTRGDELTPTDCNDVVAGAVDDLRHAITDQDAEVTWDRLPAVMADERQLRQVFQNLISNAIKFHGDAPPRVHIAAEKSADDGWQFSVEDNGIGIDPAYGDRIFVIFQRLHGAHAYEGTGIGLAICKKIIQRHGGRIWFDSTEGEGTTFYFTLQAAEKQPAATEHHRTGEEPHERIETTTN